MGIKDIKNGTADTIVTSMKSFLTDMDMQKMAGFGSDGAAVMVGRINGVSFYIINC